MSPLLNEADISKLVHEFYAVAQKDTLLAPIFATKIKQDEWPAHMDHITGFWGSIFLKSKQFNGNPMRKHLALEGLTPAHFDKWLSLFRKSADKVLSADQADMVHTMAQRIGQSLQMGLAFNFEKSGIKDHPFTDFGFRSSKKAT